MVNQHNGSFIDWHLKLWGEAIDASKATLLPMPTEEDDDNHDKEDVATTTIQGTKTAGNAAPTKSFLPVKPTDHPDRPTKPTNSQSAPSATQTGAQASSTSTSSSWLPSFFPTFGVSSKTQIWIYGAAALILIFCGALGIYLYLARRKRLRNNPRDEWEFDLIQDDEAEGLNGGGRSAGPGRQGGRRRAGELYDAFAAGSEDGSDAEYQDDEGEGGDEREKRLYESDEEGAEQHVVGDDEDSDAEAEKREGGNLLRR
jgi:kexin